ncbi:MAG: hypothetical protein L0229_06870 [Blastocatellia bacterium]|nr:hypothetical protein [Blastocatellia bacterium]
MALGTKIINIFMALCLLAVTASFGSAGAGPRAQKKDKDDDPNSGRPILWTEPTDIESRDLFHGLGGEEGAPDPSGKFKFVRRSTSGTSEKIIVDDDKGRSWTVKFGPESRPETTVTRILWAVGYHVDQDYFVKKAFIEGRGGFEVWDVRFERRDDGYKDLGPWKWFANPFLGTREYDGLRTLMMVVGNWDLKDENNKIVRPNKESGGDRSLRVHYVSDLGGTLGKVGNPIRKTWFLRNLPGGTKNDPEGYENQVFINGVKNGTVDFNYKGKNHTLPRGVKVEHARWMGNLLGRLSNKQLSDAFRAGGFTEAEIEIYVRELRDRIDQLKALR